MEKTWPKSARFRRSWVEAGIPANCSEAARQPPLLAGGHRASVRGRVDNGNIAHGTALDAALLTKRSKMMVVCSPLLRAAHIWSNSAQSRSLGLLWAMPTESAPVLVEVGSNSAEFGAGVAGSGRCGRSLTKLLQNRPAQISSNLADAWRTSADIGRIRP